MRRVFTRPFSSLVTSSLFHYLPSGQFITHPNTHIKSLYTHVNFSARCLPFPRSCIDKSGSCCGRHAWKRVKSTNDDSASKGRESKSCSKEPMILAFTHTFVSFFCHSVIHFVIVAHWLIFIYSNIIIHFTIHPNHSLTKKSWLSFIHLLSSIHCQGHSFTAFHSSYQSFTNNIYIVLVLGKFFLYAGTSPKRFWVWHVHIILK